MRINNKTILTQEEKREFVSISQNEEIRKDMRRIKKNRAKRLLDKKNEFYMDQLLEFLSNYNAFINHKRKPLSKFSEHNMKI